MSNNKTSAKKLMTYIGQIDDFLVEESQMARIMPRKRSEKVIIEKNAVNYNTIVKGVTSVIAVAYLIKRARNSKNRRLQSERTKASS